MDIFYHEKRLGLSDSIKANSIFAFSLDIKGADIPKKKIVAEKLPVNLAQPDLFYIESILASVGWNKNDDVFGVYPTWDARNTPVDKQVNFMHNEKDIIGHIYSSWVVDSEGNEIDDSTDKEKLPDNFNVIVGSVIYKIWEDEELQNRINRVIAEIQEGIWKVSMECRIKGFDYAVKLPDGSQKIIARNDQTSFLTKYLRAYGGSGEYDGCKIGRFLKGMFFSGKGIVDNPANPESDITKFSFTGQDLIKANVMEITKEDYEKVNQELASVKASVNSLEASNKEAADIIVNLKALSQEKDAKIQALNQEVASKVSEIENIKAELKNKERVTQLVNVGVDVEKAKATVEKFATANDEMFAEVVALNTNQVKTDKETAKAGEKSLDSVKAETTPAQPLISEKEDKELERATAWVTANVIKNKKKVKE